MKKYILPFLLIVLLLSVMISGCEEEESLQIAQMQAFVVPLAAVPEELTEVSDLVIVFTPEEQENIRQYFSDGVSMGGYTKTTGKIDQVLQGNANAGDTISITEVCYFDESGLMWTINGYIPMNVGEQYLLFLNAYDDTSTRAGMYCVVSLENGKYPLDGNQSILSALFEDKLETYQLGPDGNADTYEQWFTYVKNLYPDLF